MSLFARNVAPPAAADGFGAIPIPQPIMCSGHTETVSVLKTYYADDGYARILKCDRTSVSIPQFLGDEEFMDRLRREYAVQASFMELLRDITSISVIPWNELRDKDDMVSLCTGLPLIEDYVIDLVGPHVTIRLVIRVERDGDVTKTPVLFNARCWVDDGCLRPILSNAERFFLLQLVLMMRPPQLGDLLNTMFYPSDPTAAHDPCEGDRVLTPQELRSLFKLTRECY